MKKFLSVILALCLMLLPMAVFAAAADADAADADAPEVAGEEPSVQETLVLASVADVAAFIIPNGSCEIQIAPAVLTTADGAQDVYFVALRGAGAAIHKANNVMACFLSAFNLSSKYYQMVRDAVFEYVPEGSKVVLAGHSLGGMVGQQLSCAEEFTSKYELLNTLNVGSPAVLTKNENREGTLVRCVDKQDVIPKLSPCALMNIQHYNDCIRIDGGYLGDPDGAHNKSYQRDDLWGEYDALGVKGGVAVITLQSADITALVA